MDMHVPQPAGCPSSRHAAEDDSWDWNPFSPADRATTLADARRLLDADEVAATIVAACISTTQSGRESRAAFVKRMVRSWLDEMERQGA